MQSAGMSSIIRTFVNIFYICILHHLLDLKYLPIGILNKLNRFIDPSYR